MTIEIHEGRLPLGDDLAVESLNGIIILTRTDKRILAQGRLESTIQAQCGRCLEPTVLPLRVRFDELFTFYPTSPEDKTYHIDEDGFIHLTRPLHEQVLLAMPIQPLCKPDCKGLCDQCGKNLNEGPCDCSDDVDDPRLAPLRSLLK